MDIVTIPMAKSTLSKLVKRVEAGEEIILARGQVPIARLSLCNLRRTNVNSVASAG